MNRVTVLIVEVSPNGPLVHKSLIKRGALECSDLLNTCFWDAARTHRNNLKVRLITSETMHCFGMRYKKRGGINMRLYTCRSYLQKRIGIGYHGYI